MKTHSQAFKENISLLGKQQEIKITYQENNEEKVLTGEQINSASPHYEGNLLKSVMKELDLDSNVDISPETEVNFQYGIAVVDKDLNYKEKEGNPITCENAINEKIRNLVVNGKSKQATRSGKNKFKISNFQKEGWNIAIDNPLKGFNSGQYTISCVNAYKENIGIAIAFSNQPFDGIIGNYFTGYNFGNGTKYNNTQTITQEHINAEYMRLMPQDSGVTQEILENMQIQIEEGSTPTSYEPYGASPSPEYPSEIHSVADDVNLLNLENIENHSVNSYYENIGTSFQLKAGETYTLSFDAESDITPFDVGIGCGSSGNYQSDILNKHGFQNGRISITFTPQNSNFTYGNYLALRFVRYNSSTSYTYSARNIKLQKGTEATPYSPYNQGTVTIKQRGKNLYDVGKTTDYTGSTISNLSIQNNQISNKIDSGNASYIIQNNQLNVNNFYFSANYDRQDSTPRFLIRAYNSNDEQITSNVNGWNYNSYYNAYFKDESGNFDLPNASYVKVGLAWKGITGEIGTYTSIMLSVESISYEPYFKKDYIFQTSPLRSLPNGVKDTIEEDGIHRRVGRIVLDGSENWAASGTSTSGIYRPVCLVLNGIIKAPSLPSTSPAILCDYYKAITNNQSYTKTEGISIATSGRIEIYDSNYNTDDISLYKEWLSTHPTEVIYELAEEIIEPFTEEQEETLLNIKTEVGTNIFTITNDLLPTFSLDYAISSQNYDYAHHLIEYEYLNFGNYIVFSSEKQEDTYSYKIKCYDKMLYSMKPYQNMNITYPITIRNYIATLCNHLNLVFANSNNTFTNYDKQIPNELYLDNEGNDLGYTFRDVLDELAQVTGSVICVNNNDELEIRYINNTNDTIDEEYLKDINVNFGEKYGPINTVILSRSAGADKISMSNPANLPDNEKVAIEISDNQIMNFNNRNEYLSSLLTRLYGTQYYLNDFTSTGIVYYDLMDKYNVQIGENTYNCLMLNNEVNIDQGLEEQIHTDMPETSDTDYSKTDKTDRRINQTYLIVDKQNQRIDSVITNVTEQNNKISQITQTVDELNSKISNIADITIAGESMIAVVQLDNINQSEPIEIRVRPITENISYLYPRNNLYPSDNLYMKERKIRFVRTYEEDGETKTENIDYEIPDDLLYYDSNTYDEFYLNYNSETCQIIKKCKYNADGTVGLLSMAETTDYEYPHILLDDGNYTIQLLGYNIGYLSVRLMAQNIYTTQFATKAELSSSITQTANEINLRVDEKLDEEDFTSANIMLKINNDESQASINADKINLNGVVTANNNFKILSDGSMEAVNGTFKNGKIFLSTASQGANIFKIQKTGASNTFLQLGFNLLQLDYAGSTLITLGRGEVSGSSVGSISLSGRGYTSLQSDGIITPKVTQTSLEKDKKNISKYNKSALNEIKNIDIYTYNLKTELDTDKKHIGFIIGENYNYSKDVVDYDSGQNEIGVDNYSFVSLCCKAIQEQQEIIENLQKQINELKGDK